LQAACSSSSSSQNIPQTFPWSSNEATQLGRHAWSTQTYHYLPGMMVN